MSGRKLEMGFVCKQVTGCKKGGKGRGNGQTINNHLEGLQQLYMLSFCLSFDTLPRCLDPVRVHFTVLGNAIHHI